MIIYVGNINFSTTKEELSLLFSQFGEVLKVDIPRDKRTKLPIGYAFLKYNDTEACNEAVKYLDKVSFGGRELLVSLSKRN